ncbi:unnamed protein product [Microthlaspi erraticum]|uniref:Uncharacterized protein n=1 Tax=Microthlaspi erraticum TaxID=1685480 RepID=A0A6D2L266_9BRAS|nr:unnamed protein product [Microthlaspi erraticum]
MGLELSKLDRVEAWPVELRNSTGWSSRWSSWSSRWLLPSSFAYPVELRPCAKSLHAPTSHMLQNAPKDLFQRTKHAYAPSVKPSQLTMTLFPTKFENGKIEYKIRYKGRSRPFSRAKALVTSEQSRDPTKLKELLSQVLTITLDGGTSSTNA